MIFSWFHGLTRCGKKKPGFVYEKCWYGLWLIQVGFIIFYKKFFRDSAHL